jgi:hypothetical protein
VTACVTLVGDTRPGDGVIKRHREYRGDFLKPLTAIATRSLQAAVTILLTVGLSSLGTVTAHAEDTTTTISGLVTLNGTPGAGLEVCAYVPVITEDGYANAAGDCIFTDSEGSYEFSFALAEANGMASVWVKPGAADTFPQTTYGTSLRDPNGYFTVVPGEARVLNEIALVTTATEITAAKPTITGKAALRRVLTVQPGVWGPQDVQLSYQWYRGGKKISGATKATYRVSWRDWRKKLSVKVTGTLDGYSAVAQVSKPTKKVSWR